MERNADPSDVSDEEWAFAGGYLTLMTEDAPQRHYPLRVPFNGLRWLIRAGAPWRIIPNDLSPWAVVYQQTQCWLKAGVFESMAHDLRAMLRLADGRASHGVPGQRCLLFTHLTFVSLNWNLPHLPNLRLTILKG